MARIRTIKPEFFRHEGLQDLEAQHPGNYGMLVFVGIWSVCDRAGRFEWRPRQLKLDILPFLDFSMESTLELLRSAGFIVRYVVDGRTYGLIPSFEKHQRFTGKEATEPPRFPAPPEGSIGEFPIVSQGSGREATGIPGKGMEYGVQEKEMINSPDGESAPAKPSRKAKAPKPDSMSLDEILGKHKDAYWALATIFGGQLKNPAPKTTAALYVQALKVVSAEVIQAKAQGLARSNSDIKFMPQLAKWLEGQGYLNPDLPRQVPKPAAGAPRCSAEEDWLDQLPAPQEAS
jgi:hypothetical protein